MHIFSTLSKFCTLKFRVIAEKNAPKNFEVYSFGSSMYSYNTHDRKTMRPESEIVSYNLNRLKVGQRNDILPRLLQQKRKLVAKYSLQVGLPFAYTDYTHRRFDLSVA